MTATGIEFRPAIISRKDDQPVTGADHDAIIDGLVGWCEANGYVMFSISGPIDDEGEKAEYAEGER